MASDLEIRAAAHEAGHAVVAWFSPFVLELTRVSIEPSEGIGGQTQFLESLLGDPSHDWYRVAVHLGGAAGESAYLGSFQGYGASRDLMEARRVAETMVDGSAGRGPPWVEPAAGIKSPDFGKVFTVPTPPATCAILKACYRRARGLIESDRARYGRLVYALHHKKVIEGGLIAEIFGIRPKSIFVR